LPNKTSIIVYPEVFISWLANFLTNQTRSVISFVGKSKKSAITRSIIHGSGTEPAAFMAMIADL
jgi:hypothetical protein